MMNRKLILMAALALATAPGAARAQSNGQAQATASQSASTSSDLAGEAAPDAGSLNPEASDSAAGTSSTVVKTDRAAGTLSGAASQKASAIRPGTRIPAELQSALDARNAKPSDQVVAKITKDVKQDGQVVVHKGDRLIGHVDSVQAKGNGSADSQLTVSFDRLVTRSTVVPLSAVVTAVMSAAASEQFNSMDSGPAMGAPAMSAPRSSGGGGLPGGAGSAVGSTVSGTLGEAGNRVGGVANAAGSVTGQASGSATGALSPLTDIQITSTNQASGRGSATSTLSSRNRNLRLDKGTQMEFQVAGSSNESAQMR